MRFLLYIICQVGSKIRKSHIPDSIYISESILMPYAAALLRAVKNSRPKK